MFREFNVKFEDVEMLGGADNLLEGTEITKVIVRGDNNKMSSLDSMLKNCNELDTIDGELDLNGVSDIDNLLEGTELVKSIDLKNINNENISANNSFPHVDRINIGGELYNKKAMQNVIASKDWTFDNINYSGTVGDNIVTKEVNIVDNNKVTIKDTLEQKAKGIEIIGQTYENLVVGSGEATLLDELTLESIDGSPNEFTPHIEQPVCVESIEGETYQNLIEGKGEYKLTDTFSTTWTESNNSIENPPSMIEIPEIFGNTVQGYANVLTPYVIKEHWEKANWITNATIVNKYTINASSIANSGNLESAVRNDNSLAIQLKANTTYTLKIECPHLGSTSWIRGINEDGSIVPLLSLENKTGCRVEKFTTTSTGKIAFGVRPDSTSSSKDMKTFCVEGDVDLSLYDFGEFDLEYIQSVGDLYVDESGEPILDEEGNEQYKLDMISHGYTTDEVVVNGVNGRAIIQNLLLPTGFLNISVAYGTPTRAYFHCIAKIDTTKAKTGTFCTFSQGGGYSIKYNSTDHSLKLSQGGSEYFLSCVNHNEPFSITIKQSNDDKIIHVYFNGIEVVNIVSETMGFSHTNFVAFNSHFHTGAQGGCNYINIIYAQCSKDYGSYIGVDEDDWNNINKWNKTTILMPQQLKKFGRLKKYHQSTGDKFYDMYDKLYYDYNSQKFFIKNIPTVEHDILNVLTTMNPYTPIYTRSYNGEDYYNIQIGFNVNNNIFGVLGRGGTDDLAFMVKTTYPLPLLTGREYTMNWGTSNTTKLEGYCFGYITSASQGWSFLLSIKASNFGGRTLDKAGLIDFFTTYPTSVIVMKNQDYTVYLETLDNVYEIVETKILEKPSLEAYSPKTYITTNTEIQPSQMTITNKRNLIDLRKIKSNTDYTLQLKCNEKGNKPIKINLCGKEKDIDATIGVNHVNITTNELNDNKLELSGEGNIVSEIIVVEGEMNQYPEYFNGVQSVGELQGDGTYEIGLETNCGEGLDFSNTKPTMIINQNGNMANDSYVTSEGYLCILRNDGGYGYNQLYGFFDTDSIGIPRGVDCYVSYRTLYMIVKDIGRVNLTNQPNRYGVVVDSSSSYVTGSNSGITTGVINIPNDGARYYLKTQVSYDRYALQNNTCQEFCLIYNCMPTNLPVTLENFKPIKKHKTSISSNSPLAKGDKLYWNKSNKRYEIDRNGVIEVPTVIGDVIDLPRLYQRDDTNLTIESGNIKPAKTKIVYKDII